MMPSIDRGAKIMKDPFKNLLLTILNEYSDIKKFGYGGNKLNV